MISRNCKNLRRVVAACLVRREGATIRENQAPFVILVIGERINLIATEDENIATLCGLTGDVLLRFRSAER